jgi:tRNA-dihydrouridine synthase B
MNRLESCDEQVRAVGDWFDELALAHRLLPPAAANDDYVEQLA